ncbi:MAG TPA: ECF-type sigma factor [Phycisphaerae bacterium]|nr:ECF-type sigma factor [Phycisphaerae bacterium]HRW54852.1 ECF-type sigma factor [Phycisphaerae bacterium]
MQAKNNDITWLLERAVSGDIEAWDSVIPLIYEELRSLAEVAMRGERRSHTLQPTALVHEAFIRLVRQNERSWESRAHFFAAAAETMRRLLVDHARTRKAARRGGGARHETLDPLLISFESRSTDLLALDAALDDLQTLDRRQARIVELRFFGGLSVDQVADVLRVSQSTVERDWRIARAWLLREIGGQASAT